MAKNKVKFPNPAFFRAKDNMDWKKQGENLLEVGGIIVDMFKEISKTTAGELRKSSEL